LTAFLLYDAALVDKSQFCWLSEAEYREENHEMKKMKTIARLLAFIALVMFGMVSQSRAASMDQHEIYTGMCDASGAVAVGASMFVVASDEDNILRLYRANGSDHHLIQTFDLSPYLNLDVRHPEADIEAATRVGHRMYWITSHGANKKGKLRRSRHKLFATEIQQRGDQVLFEFVGHPYERLLDDLSRVLKWHGFALTEAAHRPPKSPGGLNIEALAAAPDGSLWVAFRNPVPNAKALLVRLKNPSAVMAGESALWGEPMSLGLQGLGIRGMEYAPLLRRYLIIAGSFDRNDVFKLYSWSGVVREKAEPIDIDLAGLKPESVIVYPDGRIELLSDDGSKRVAGKACKSSELAKRSFRSLRLGILDGGQRPR
jgi:hypothetical protein